MDRSEWSGPGARGEVIAKLSRGLPGAPSRTERAETPPSTRRARTHRRRLRALFVLGSHRVGFLRGFLEAEIFVPVAKLAYSLYLVHPVVYGVLGTAFASHHVARTDANVAALLGASVAGSFALALVLYLLVEKPIMDLRPPAK